MLAWTKISCEGSMQHISLEYVGSNPTQLANFYLRAATLF